MEKKAGSEKSAETKPKKPLWKRIVKGLLWFLGGTLVFVLVAVLTLPLWINPVATSLVKSLVPGYTGTPFNIVRVDLNPYTGKLLITGVELANPEGYSVKDAFALGSLSVDVEVSSLLSKTIHVRDITIDSPFASYVFDEGGVNNFDRIIEAVNKKLGPKKEKKEEPGETKVVIDKVTVKNVKVAVGKGRFELASLVLTDFGKDDAPARLVISGVQLVNPPGFVTENAFSLNSLAIDVETGDLAKLPIKVHDLVIDSPYASYVFDEKNVDNFTRLLEPLLAQGGKPEKEPKKEKKSEEKKTGPSGSPVTVDRLEVKNLKTHVCNGRFEFASLVVTDFGKPTVATVTLEGVKLVNPDGFKTPNAFSLGSLSVGLETGDLSKKPMVLHDIALKSLYAGYVFDESGASNIDVMFKPLMGGGKKADGKSENAVVEKKEDVGKTGEGGKGGLPVAIDKVTLEDLRADVGAGKVELKSITLTDFGKETPTKLEISGVKLANPPGFKAENAFSLGSLTLGMDLRDLGKPPFKIQEIVIDSPYASYVFDEKNVDNFTRMLEPLLAQGGKPEKEPKKEKKAEEKKAGPSGAPVTVDRLEVKNLKTHVCNGRFEFDSLVVTDFGKPTVATVTLEGVKLVNPDGFKTPNAFSLGSLSVGLETGNLSKKPMVLHDIALKSLYAGYVFDESGASNIDVMFKPLMGGGKKADGKSENALVEKKEDVGKTDEGGKGGLPVAIDKVTLEDLRADVGAGKAELKSITLTNFGKETPTKLEISGVKLANPPGFKAENAFSLGSLTLGMDLRDLGKPPFKIQEIVIDSPYASYVFDEKNVDNFTRLLEPLLAKGGKPEKEPKKEKKAEEKKTGPSGAPVTVDRLEVTNLKTHVCNGRFEFDSLVVTDFGKSTNTQVRLENVNLVNPEGFAGPNAFSLKSLSVGLETADLSKKPMVFHDIIVDSPYAGVFINGDWVLNFKALFKPLMGDKKEDEKDKKIAADEKKDEEKEKDGDAARVVIDKLEISGTKIQFDSPIPILKGTIGIPLPTFTDIGKESKDGATVREVGEKILEKVEKLAGPLGSTLDKIVRNPSLNMKELFDVDAMKALGNAKDFLASGTTNVLGNAKDFVSVGATNVLGNAKDFISGGTTNILGGAKSKLGDAVGNTKDFISGLIPGGDKKEGDKKTDGKKENEKKKEDDGSGTSDRETEGVKGR